MVVDVRGGPVLSVHILHSEIGVYEEEEMLLRVCEMESLKMI